MILLESKANLFLNSVHKFNLMTNNHELFICRLFKNIYFFDPKLFRVVFILWLRSYLTLVNTKLAYSIFTSA